MIAFYKIVKQFYKENRNIMKRANIVLVTLSMLGVLALLSLPAQPLHAQEEEISQLRQKITELEGRIKELEGLLSETRKKQMADQYAWQNKKNWRKLEVGMGETQVKTILGEPIKVISGVKTLWYYPNIYCGYVSFDENGYLAGWSEP